MRKQRDSRAYKKLSDLEKIVESYYHLITSFSAHGYSGAALAK